jgi:hypothetical protein
LKIFKKILLLTGAGFGERAPLEAQRAGRLAAQPPALLHLEALEEARKAATSFIRLGIEAGQA